MTQIEMLQQIEEFCNKAGADRNIRFNVKSRKENKWEVNFLSKSHGGITVSMRYWKMGVPLAVSYVSLSWPPTEEQRNEFVEAVA
jgi:hypothetical protein